MPDSHPKILIQLIGAQAQPNAVCIKTVNPQVVVNVHTEKTKTVANHLEDFLRTHLRHIRYQSIQASAFPSVDETKVLFGKIFTLLREKVGDAEYIVNYTGGTKPMSIGAFLAGLECGAKLLYVENANVIREGEGLEVSRQWRPQQLSLEETLAIEGTAIQDTVELSPRRIAMAHQIRRLREKENKKFKENRFCFYPASKEQSFKKVPSNITEHFKKVLRFGIENGGIFNDLIALCKEEAWLNPDSSISGELLNDFKKLSSVNAFLDGGWWEVLVAEAFKRLAPGDSTRWSVTAAGNMEDDVLSVFAGRLFVVSCKAGYDQKGFKSEFHRIADRAKQLGGSHAVPVFARYGPLSPEMKDYSRQLKIPVIRPFMLSASNCNKLKEELIQFSLNIQKTT